MQSSGPDSWIHFIGHYLVVSSCCEPLCLLWISGVHLFRERNSHRGYRYFPPIYFFFFQQTYYFQNVLPSVWSAAPMMCCHKAPNRTVDQKVQESLPALPENYLRN